MRRHQTFDAAGVRVRARDPIECLAKLEARKRGCCSDILDADIFVRLPLQQVSSNQERVDRLLYNYFGALGFAPEEGRTAAEEGRFKKYGMLNGIEVGTIAVGDSVYLAARPIRDPIDQPGEKALLWLGRVMATAKRAANHVFEQSELRADSDVRAVIAYRDNDGDLRIEERRWDRVVKQQADMAEADYEVVQRDDFARWLKTMSDNYEVTDTAWAAGELLIKTEAAEIAVIFEGGRYRFLDADAIGTPSRAEYVAALWKKKYEGFTLVGAREMVEAQERLPEWLTQAEREQVMQRVNQSLRMLFYGSELHPELPALTAHFNHIADQEVWETFFREMDAGKIPFQIDKQTGRVEVDARDAVRRLEEVFSAAKAEETATMKPEMTIEINGQHRRKGIRV